MTPRPGDFDQYCCELLSSVGPCVARKMFGGCGISIDELSLPLSRGRTVSATAHASVCQ